MKLVSIAELRASLAETLETSQTERIIVTRHGRPVAIVSGCEGESLDDIVTMASDEFWRSIRDSLDDPRPSLPLSQVKDRIERRGDRSPKSHAPRRRTKKTS